MKNKKGQVWETLIPWMIGLAILALAVVIYLILSGKGQAALIYFKNILKFGG